MQKPVPTSVTFDQVILEIQPGITWSLHESGGRPYYLIEDTIQSRFFRVGVREQAVLELIDGERSLGRIAEMLTRSDGTPSLTPNELKTLCNWLLQTELVGMRTVHGTTSGGGHRAAPAWWHQVLANPLFIKIPLFNPDRLLTWLFPVLRWSLTRAAFTVWLLVVALAVLNVAGRWDDFQRQLSNILAPSNWYLLILGWLGLKVIHELYHGLVCKLYGGTVNQAGMMLILFSPVAYVDVTSSWKFRNKWQRINTAAAGMYAEFFVAALAGLTWCYLEDTFWRQVCHNLVTMASVTTLVFNGNFLMRFDGYYIFSDLFEFQNLYTSARLCTLSRLKTWFLGLSSQAPEFTGWRYWVVHLYGWASLVWRILFAVGIMIVSARMFQGLGLILAAITAVSWFAIPAWKSLQLARRPSAARPNWVRFATLTTALAGCLLGLSVLPWPGGVRAPAVVEYSPLHLIRVDSPGFIESVRVREGQQVAPGDVLVVLRNPETQQRLEDLELEIAQSEVRSRILRSNDETSEYLVENRNRQALEERRDQLLLEVEKLTIRATCAGRIVGRDLESLPGQYASMGRELMAVGDENAKVLEASVAQQDIDYFRSCVGGDASFYLRGSAAIEPGARLTRVNPRASTQARQPGLLATAGGPLAVAVRANPGDEGTESENHAEFTAPRFTAIIELPPPRAAELRAGQVAYVRLGVTHKTIGQHLAGLVRGWIDLKSGDPPAG